MWRSEPICCLERWDKALTMLTKCHCKGRSWPNSTRLVQWHSLKLLRALSRGGFVALALRDVLWHQGLCEVKAHGTWRWVSFIHYSDLSLCFLPTELKELDLIWKKGFSFTDVYFCETCCETYCLVDDLFLSAGLGRKNSCFVFCFENDSPI